MFCNADFRLIETWDVLKCICGIWKKESIIWLIETWDVLKYFYGQNVYQRHYTINRNMRCIEILKTNGSGIVAPTINRNMRCIEINCRGRRLRLLPGLIETWDVLKYPIPYVASCIWYPINRNMRCIEILLD